MLPCGFRLVLSMDEDSAQHGVPSPALGGQDDSAGVDNQQTPHGSHQCSAANAYTPGARALLGGGSQGGPEQETRTGSTELAPRERVGWGVLATTQGRGSGSSRGRAAGPPGHCRGQEAQGVLPEASSPQTPAQTATRGHWRHTQLQVTSTRALEPIQKCTL